MEVITTYKRFDGETDEELIYRVCKDKDIIGSWQDVADILNELCNAEFSESKYRKQYQAFSKMFEANQKIFSSDCATLDEIREQTRELEREKVKFRDERKGWNLQNYTAARVEENLDKIAESLCEIGKTNFSSTPPVDVNSDNDLLIALSDLHIGQTFDSAFGKYNSDIAKSRLNEYLEEILKIQKRHNSENAYVMCLGDLISGSIHLTLQISNRENVIEQTKLAIEMISSFCYELTRHFKRVFFSDCSGNHSRLVENKEKAVHDERMDNLIAWSVGNMLNHIDNFTVLNRKLDNGIIDVFIRNKTYIGVHGDMDNMTKGGIGNFVVFLGFMPYAVISGHRHFPAMSDESGIRTVQSGTLAGGGDNYCIEKRLNGSPSQTVCVCTQKGIECIYPVML